MFKNIFNLKRKNECGLLPHTRENIHGLYGSMQFYPWPIKLFDVEKTWNKTMGENVTVGVLDTGCDSAHDDLKDNLLQGWNAIKNNSNTNDDNGHGTHVAGTIGAANNLLGVVGVAPKIKILPVKVLNEEGMGSNLDVARGIIWACDNGADILTMSLGSDHPSKPLEDALKYAVSKNVIIFCAAGNSGNDTDIKYPAKYPQTISIGAIDKNLKICSFSCTGDSLDFVAPGQDIPSCMPNNSYALMSGTSMATPFAVGCAALLLSSARTRISGKKLTKDEYIEIFSKYSRHLSQSEYAGNRRYEGNGIIYPVVI
jgi:subtilisin family serine protease